VPTTVPHDAAAHVHERRRSAHESPPRIGYGTQRTTPVRDPRWRRVLEFVSLTALPSASRVHDAPRSCGAGITNRRWNEIPMVRLNVSAMAMDMLMTRPGSVRERA